MKALNAFFGVLILAAAVAASPAALGSILAGLAGNGFERFVGGSGRRQAAQQRDEQERTQDDEIHESMEASEIDVEVRNAARPEMGLAAFATADGKRRDASDLNADVLAQLCDDLVLGALVPARALADRFRYAPRSSVAVMAPQAVQIVGANQSHPNMQPSLAINYIICTLGLYPSRP